MIIAIKFDDGFKIKIQRSYNEREPNAEADNSFMASVSCATLQQISQMILFLEMPFYAYGYQVQGA